MPGRAAAGRAPPPPPVAPWHAVGALAPDDGVDVRFGNGEPPSPWHRWDQVDFHERLRGPLLAAGFPAPSAIQQYAWPIVRSGRDVIGVAKTGSGKTLAFLLPAFSQLLEGKDASVGPPAILVLAPTRELACQIEGEAQKFGAPAGMRSVALYGGAPKGPQLGALRRRPHLVVATPGRLNDFLEPAPGVAPGVDLAGIGFLVLDEADRMLDMGFEPQIRKVVAKVPRQRQTMMFSATWPQEVRRLAADFLREPAEVRVGNCDELQANADIEQRVEFCSDVRDKEEKLRRLLKEHEGQPTIIFVNTKRFCDSIASGIPHSVTIHGDRTQEERDFALASFKRGTSAMLVATDVAARGLDIKGVKLVVNFDSPPREEDYVHRIGRTGRAGEKGLAVSLLTNEDGGAARNIAEVMKRSGFQVPAHLEERLLSGEMRFPMDRGPRDRDRERDKDRDRARRRAHSVPVRPDSRADFGGRAGGGGGFGGNDCPTDF